MDSFEKKILITMAIIALLGIVSLASCNYQVQKAGGYKQLLIDAGKDMKDIKKQINED